MNTYMIKIDLPQELDDDFLSLIPSQRVHIHELMAKNVIISYALAADRSKLWVVVSARNTAEVRDILQTFPLYRYIKGEISHLAFHEHVAFQMPEISLN